MLHIAWYLGGVSRHVRVSPHTTRWLPIRLHRKSAEERDSKSKVRKVNLKSKSWSMHVKSKFVVTIWSPLSKFRLRPTLIPHFKTAIKIPRHRNHVLIFILEMHPIDFLLPRIPMTTILKSRTSLTSNVLHPKISFRFIPTPQPLQYSQITRQKPTY